MSGLTVMQVDGYSAQHYVQLPKCGFAGLESGKCLQTKSLASFIEIIC